MKLALGTVQFGLDYGISNHHGQVDKAQVADILVLAECLGIDTLDCAGAYGNSEQIIGELLTSSPQQSNFNLVSKIPALSRGQSSIAEYFSQSLINLQTDTIDTLLFHHADNLLSHPNRAEFFQQLQKLKKQQRVKRIGASLYSPAQLMSLSEQYAIDVAQVPLNIFDQRFIADEIINLCAKKNIKLHVRSLFLQGLLFIKANNLPHYFSPYQDKLNAFSELAKHLGCSKLTLALAIVAQDLPPLLTSKALALKTYDVIEKVVVGVCSTEQLTEVVSAYQQAKNLPVSTEELSMLADQRLEFINPSLWAV